MASKLDLAETDKEREDAAFQLILDALEKDRAERRKTRRLCVICSAVCVVALLLFGGLFAVLAAGVTITTDESTKEEYSQSIEGDSAVINNGEFEQYNDNAVNGGGD